MSEVVTTDTIIDFLQVKVEQKEPISPSVWLDAAQKLNVLTGDETDKLYDMQQKVAIKKVSYIEAGKSVSEAKSLIEATDEHKEMMKQKAKVSRIEEFIRIAKIQARMKDNEWRNQG